RPPYTLAFALDGGAPRVLVASQELAVPLTLTNTGTREWDPPRIHLSYHWVWFIPRELPARSLWAVPYPNGVRTELAGAVPAGGRLGVQGRLLAPDLPGVYWLQWDMVEEGVAWFAQLSPRQPRQLVIVVPTLAGLFAPLPLLIALAGLIGIARRPSQRWLLAFVAVADVWWCTATLFSKPLLLVHE